MSLSIQDVYTARVRAWVDYIISFDGRDLHMCIQSMTKINSKCVLLYLSTDMRKTVIGSIFGSTFQLSIG